MIKEAIPRRDANSHRALCQMLLSRWAQELGEKQETLDIGTIIQAAAWASAALITRHQTRIRKKGIMSCLTWRPQHLWPSWPRSCSDTQGATPPQGPGAPQPRRARLQRGRVDAEYRLPGQARAKEATENVAWDGDQPVERRQKGRQGSRVK